jgi:hypothetical protein
VFLGYYEEPTWKIDKKEIDIKRNNIKHAIVDFGGSHNNSVVCDLVSETLSKLFFVLILILDNETLKKLAKEAADVQKFKSKTLTPIRLKEIPTVVLKLSSEKKCKLFCYWG